jgi:hypothetical protein
VKIFIIPFAINVVLFKDVGVVVAAAAAAAVSCLMFI